jgi:hypothetical protein
MFGTRLAASGADVVKIRRLKGNASSTITMPYMRASDSGEREAIARMAASYSQKMSQMKNGRRLNCRKLLI